MAAIPDRSADASLLRAARLLSLRMARNQELVHCHQHFLSPVIKLGEEKTYQPWEKATCPAVVVKAQDLLFRSGLSFKPIFNEIEDAGGIRKYLGFDGHIILSSIMRDQTILGFTPESYAKMIHVLKPDYYLTPDGETYSGEEHLSKYEINRILEDTDYLLRECPESKPIGLVKGCNVAQIGEHAEALLGRGLYFFAFHAGDYICRGDETSIMQATMFAKHIREKVPWLLVYGVGAGRNLVRFRFADGFVTQSHYINALNGKKLVNGRWLRLSRAVTHDDVQDNLAALEDVLISLDTQTGLKPWLAEEIVPCLATTRKQVNEVGGLVLPGAD